MMMGGRAADRLIYGQPYAGAEMDLKQATQLARYMVTHWGMSDGSVRCRSASARSTSSSARRSRSRATSARRTAAVIDEEVQKLLREADEHAYELLKANRDKVERIVDALMQREELLRDEIEAILNEVEQRRRHATVEPRRSDCAGRTRRVSVLHLSSRRRFRSPLGLVACCPAVFGAGGVSLLSLATSGG